MTRILALLADACPCVDRPFGHRFRGSAYWNILSYPDLTVKPDDPGGQGMASETWSLVFPPQGRKVTGAGDELSRLPS